MKVRADAFPLAGPLAGGLEGASVVVEPIEAGRARFPTEFFERIRGPFAPIRALGLGRSAASHPAVPVQTFLIRHPRAGAILVDTGLHPSVSSDPAHSMGRIAGRYFELEQGEDVVSQLRDRGLGPGDIETVVLTHLHLDHASAISEFPESVFVLADAEWEAATSGARPLLRGYRPAHYDHAFDYRTLDFDLEAIDSYGAFARTFDLFGDGSIRLAFTPGHSPGHMSVICRLPRRDFVIAGDAAYTWRQLNGGSEPYHVDDAHSWRRSLRELQHFHRAYPYTLIVPGHDRVFWEKLEKRYAE